MDANEVLLDQARQQLLRQETKLTSFRTTVGTALAAGGVVAGLLAARLGHQTAIAPVVLTLLALVAFGGGVVAAVRVLAPQSGYHFAIGLTDQVGWCKDNGEAPGAGGVLARKFAERLDQARESNEAKLDDTAVWMQWCCILLAVQVALWVLAIIVS